MPRIRRALVDVVETATTYSDIDRETSSADFLKDPDLFKDPLPQPYRRIDKILQDLFDEVWEIVDKKDTAKRIEASKPRPEKYSSGSLIPDIGEFNCMCASSDDANEYIFVASNKGGVLTCVDAAGMCALAEIDLSAQLTSAVTSSVVIDHSVAAGINITSITSARLKASLHLVACLSDTGCLFLSLFSGVKFIPVQSLVDLSATAEKKSIFRKVEISRNCDFIAVLVESRNETCIEVYKCMRDVWSQMAEADAAAAAAQQRARTANTTVRRSSTEGGESNLLTAETGLGVLAEVSSVATASKAPGVDVLPKPTLACRLRPSSNQIKFPTASSGLTPAQLFKSVEANGDVIGIGANSCVTRAYVDVKTQFVERVFDVRLDEETSGHLNGTKNYDLKIDAEFKFLPSNRFVPSEISVGSANSDLPVSLAVCWNRSNQVLFYPLAKVNKELESKFDYTLSFASGIEQIELTRCLTRAAFLLRNSNLIVINLSTGLSSCCDVNFAPTKETLDRVAFVPVSSADASPMQTSTPQINVSARLVGLTSAGRVFSIDTNDASTITRCVFQPQLANKDDKIEFISTFRNLSSLILAVSSTQKVFVLDIDKGKLVCELVAKLGESEIAPSTNFQAAYSSKNFQLFIKGEREVESNNSTLTCHSLRLVAPLDDYISVNHALQSNCLPVNSLLAERVASLLRFKIEEESARRQRLNLIWDQLESYRNF